MAAGYYVNTIIGQRILSKLLIILFLILFSFFTQKIYYALFNTHSHAHTDSLPAESQLLAETNAPFSSIYASLCIMPPTLTNTHTLPSKDGAFTSRHHIKPAHKDTHAYHIINIYGYTHTDTKPLQ